MALVAAELVGANSGLGFLINDARTVLRTDYVIVGMATIGVVGLAIDRVIRIAGARLLPWSQAMRDEPRRDRRHLQDLHRARATSPSRR
jgi:NitT/TauT family transport system permease protein/taurine transport system permease protein